jgi:phosphoribosylamine---glycine ligase
MRILGLGDCGDLGDLYAHLAQRGHQVRMAVADPAYRDVFRGLVEHTADWRRELAWVKAAGRDGVVVCETAHDGALQDALRRDGFQVIGGSALGDRLEGDRAFGQQVLRRAGLKTIPTVHFTDLDAAIAHIRAHPRRYVLKHNGHHLPSTCTHVGCLPDGADVIAALEHHRGVEAVDVVLMDVVDGVETGVGAYFDGRRFIGPVCLDWEHKRFFPGDLGELTGEMGTVVTYRGAERLFSETLAPLAPLLAAHGHCGYLNLNTVINDDGVWPLEFTCRFGYPGFAILAALHVDGWEPLLRALCGEDVVVRTHPGYAVGVVVTVPPFPGPTATGTYHARGMPIRLDGLGRAELEHVHFGEVDFSSGSPRVGGASGYVLVATGRGPDVPAARDAVHRVLDRIQVPNARYRRDIGCRFIARDEASLRRLGYLGASSASIRR